MKIIDCEQGTPEWHAARCGRLTASRIADIMRKTKTGVSKMRATYAGQLIAERLSGVQEETYTSAAMQHGKDTEDQARAMYAFMHDVQPQTVGLVIHPRLEMAAASCDRLVGDNGLIEIKCPNSATHIETLLGAEIDPDYVKQMQWQMACTERAWCDFVSFDPRMPGDMQIHVQRVPRDNELIAELEREAVSFLAEIDDRIARLLLKFRYGKAAA
jgi:putative phage-type endonuclease